LLQGIPSTAELSRYSIQAFQSFFAKKPPLTKLLNGQRGSDKAKAAYFIISVINSQKSFEAV
jgi:hypothetical protein